MVNLENANVAIRFLYLISLIGLAVFLYSFGVAIEGQKN